MKKICALLICAIIVLCIFSSCSNPQSPEEVANIYLSAMPLFDYDKMDTVSIIPYKLFFQSVVDSVKESLDISEEEAYKHISESVGLENEIHSYEEYKKEFGMLMNQELVDEYGENYSMDVSIISITDLTDEDKSELLKEASDYYDKNHIRISDIVDFSKIEQCKQVDAKVYYNGKKVDEIKTDNISIYLAKVNGEWKVLNIGSKQNS